MTRNRNSDHPNLPPRAGAWASALASPSRSRWPATDAVPILVDDDDPGTLRHVRDKLADEAGRPALIVNERGLGYRMPRPGDR